MNTSKSPWTDYYIDAARMWLDIDTIERDLEISDENNIFYAIDTNVIFLYAEPFENLELVRSFKDEEETVLQAIAISLGNAIFFDKDLLPCNKNNIDRYLLFPTTLTEEFLDVFQAINKYSTLSEKVNIEIKKEIENKHNLQTLINQYKKTRKKNDTNEIVQAILNDFPNIIRYLDDSEDSYFSKQGVLGRLSRLADSESFSSIENNLNLPMPSAEVISEKKKDWYRRLVKTISQSSYTRKADRINNDARTLAWIDWVNNEFLLNGEKSRLLYLTFDNALIKTVAEAESENVISFNFVRHPRKYIPFIKANNASHPDRMAGINQLKLTLGNFLEPIKLESERAAQFTRSVENKKPPSFSDILDMIVNHDQEALDKINKVISLYSSIDKYGDIYKNIKEIRMQLLSLGATNNWLDNQVKHISVLLKEIRDKDIDILLIEKQQKVFAELSRKLSDLGVLSIGSEYRDDIVSYLNKVGSDQNNSARGPVTLRRCLEKGDSEFFDNIHELVYIRAWSELLDIIKRSSEYIKWLIVALIASDAGDWRNARSYCCKALNVSLKPETHNEAHYFYAIATRHNCINCGDYLEAKEYLDKFKILWDARYSDENYREDHRYESERLSLHTAYFNYKKFNIAWDKHCAIEQPLFSETWNDLIQLGNLIEKQPIGIEPDSVSRRIKRQIYSNQCCLYIFYNYGDAEEIIGEVNIENFDAEGRLAFQKLIYLQGDPKFRTSYFINFLSAFLNWHFSLQDIKQDNEDEAIQKNWLSAIKMTRMALKFRQIPYEENKYCHFINKLLEFGKIYGWREEQI